MTDLYAAFRLPEPPRISFPPGDTVKKEKKEKKSSLLLISFLLLLNKFDLTLYKIPAPANTIEENKQTNQQTNFECSSSIVFSVTLSV
jgi:hypothetical protein